MTLCLQSICCLWNIACCDLERSFTQKFVFPAWGVCNLNYKLYFLCCRFLIPQSLKHWFTCDNESFSNRRGSFIYKMSSEAHTSAVVFDSCLPVSNHVTTWLKRFNYSENSERNVWLLNRLSNNFFENQSTLARWCNHRHPFSIPSKQTYGPE